VERGEFSPCGTPTGVDARDPYDLQLGKLTIIFSAFPLFLSQLNHRYTQLSTYWFSIGLLG